MTFGKASFTVHHHSRSSRHAHHVLALCWASAALFYPTMPPSSEIDGIISILQTVRVQSGNVRSLKVQS